MIEPDTDGPTRWSRTSTKQTGKAKRTKRLKTKSIDSMRNKPSNTNASHGKRQQKRANEANECQGSQQMPRKPTEQKRERKCINLDHKRWNKTRPDLLEPRSNRRATTFVPPAWRTGPTVFTPESIEDSTATRMRPAGVKEEERKEIRIEIREGEEEECKPFDTEQKKMSRKWRKGKERRGGEAEVKRRWRLLTHRSRWDEVSR